MSNLTSWSTDLGYKLSSGLERQRDVDIFADKKIGVPFVYVIGMKDWLIYQHPDSIDR